MLMVCKYMSGNESNLPCHPYLLLLLNVVIALFFPEFNRLLARTLIAIVHLGLKNELS